MRTFVLVLMLALLPLRMWAAEGMGTRMAQDELAAAVGVAAMSDMPEDCPMMAHAQSDQGDSGEAPQDLGHCMACHLCAASVCLPEVAFEQGPAPTGPPAAGAPSFADAILARDLRPPIA